MSWRRAFFYCVIAASFISILCALLEVGWWPFEPFTAFLLQATLFAAITSGLTFKSARYAVGVLLAILFFAGAVRLIPFATNEHIPDTFSTCCVYVKIGHANLFSHGLGVARVRKWAKQENIEILELTEIPNAQAFNVSEAFPEYPFIASGDQHGRRKVVILSKFPLKTVHTSSVASLSVVAQLDKTTSLAIVSTHPTIPMSPRHMAGRNAAIKDAFDEAAKHPHAVVIGDFNATPWSPALTQASRKHGFERYSGGVFSSTWITPLPVLGLPIDHIYVSPTVGVYETGGGPFIFSDHWPIHATVSVPFPDQSAQ